MQTVTIAPAYGVTKTEYARQIAELETRNVPQRDGLFTRLRKRFR
jgi:hypothetical protein